MRRTASSARSPGRRDETGRWRSYTYDELLARDKVNLDIFWLRDESLEDFANPPAPDVLAAEIVEDLRTAAGAVQRDRGGIGGRG